MTATDLLSWLFVAGVGAFVAGLGLGIVALGLVLYGLWRNAL